MKTKLLSETALRAPADEGGGGAEATPSDTDTVLGTESDGADNGGGDGTPLASADGEGTVLGEDGEQTSAKTEGEETKPEGPAAFHGAPEGDYENFTIPGDLPVDEELKSEFVPLAKELGLNQAGAQKLVDFHARFVQKQSAAWGNLRTQLLEQARSAPDIGGANFEASVAAGKAAVRQFGDAEFRGMLNTFGVGNHPAMIRFLAKVGKAIGEAGITPSGGGSGVPSEKPLHELLYTHPTS